ncbi:MAG: Crp/Fnr family transcriptional regulator [Stellaceae bacterium]
MATPPTKVGNRLLDALPAKVLDALRPHLRAAPMRFGEILYQPGRKLDRVYFPTQGMISIIAGTDGASVEVSIAGSNGMFGVPLILGDDAPPQRAVVQMTGSALTMTSAALRQQLAEHPAMERLLLRYAQTVLNTASQSAACNRLHLLEQRCARWLLLALDQAPDQSIRLTHEYLATMLGVRRAGVTIAAQAFHASGLIEYKHGTITVHDRKSLEETSCECYRLGVEDFERLIGA